MPSRCIFFFSALSAWSMLLSRTMICKACSVRKWAEIKRRGSYQKAFCLSTRANKRVPALAAPTEAPYSARMAILKIARMGHPILAMPAKPVSDPRHPEIRRLVNDMVETMVDANGAGLAAPQVHVPLRVVVFQAPDGRADPGLTEDERFDHTAPLTVLINPEIEVVGRDREGGWEGCLSVPGLRGFVERPFHIRY